MARDLGFHSSAPIDVQLRNLPGLLALMRFVDVFGGNDVCVPALLVANRRPHAVRFVQRRPHGLVVGARDAIPLVESLMRGKPRLGTAEMPFTPDTGSVASRGQQLRDGNLPQRQPVRNAAKRDFVCARADGKAARHERRPTGRALRLDIEVEQPPALTGECVNTWRGRAAEDTAAIYAQLAIAQIVREHDDNVGLLRLLRCGRCARNRYRGD